jgi:hypothetical protein
VVKNFEFVPDRFDVIVMMSSLIPPSMA